MANDISVRGYVTVVLVMNMRRFIQDNDAKRFEMLRGTAPLRKALRDDWPARIEQHGTFCVSDHPGDIPENLERMSIEQVAFLSGIFRLGVLEEYAMPTYFLNNKDSVPFPDHVRDNLQFKNVFLEVWKNWKIYVRPTATGMVVITLRRHYDTTTSLLKIATHVVSLQTAFDIPSANQRLQDLESGRITANGKAKEKQQSIRAFLDWLDVDQSASWQPQYAPVQWKLAMEVCRKLMQDAGLTLDTDAGQVRLQIEEQATVTPLHDSFIVYHFDELLAPKQVLDKARGTVRPPHQHQKGTNRNPAKPEDILCSGELRQQLVALLEGAVLRRPVSIKRNNTIPREYFPEHRLPHVDDIFANNVATWRDELCVLTSRAALIMPGHHSHDDELLLSNFSASTAKVLYPWYWEAMERMFEFVIEVRVLTQQIERASSELLGEFELELTRVRHGMSRRDIRVNYTVLADKVERVANLSRLLGLGRSLTAPSVWGRAAFAVEKARLLLARQDAPTLMDHAEKNVANLNELVNHIDELYLADLSESNNRLSFYLSTLLAGLSLSVIVFAVISFWADADQLLDGGIKQSVKEWVPEIVNVGTVLSVVLSIVAIGVILLGMSSFTKDTLRTVRSRKRRF